MSAPRNEPVQRLRSHDRTISRPEAAAAQRLMDELGLPDTNGHARLVEWGRTAWSVAPTSLVDAHGETIPVRKPFTLEVPTKMPNESWVDAVFLSGFQYSGRLNAAVVNAMEQVPDFINFANSPVSRQTPGVSASTTWKHLKTCKSCTLHDDEALADSRLGSGPRVLL